MKAQALALSTLSSFIKENKGQKMTILFLKRTNKEMRLMECYLTTSKRFFANRTDKFSLTSKGLIPVLEVLPEHAKLSVKELTKVATAKCIPLDGIFRITVKGQEYMFVKDDLLTSNRSQAVKAKKKPTLSMQDKQFNALFNSVTLGYAK